MKDILTSLLFLAFTINLNSQDCYSFNDRSPIGIDAGYFYDQGNSLAFIGYKNVTLMGNLYKVGGIISHEFEEMYFEAEFLYLYREMTLLGVPERDIKANSNTLRFSAFYLFDVGLEVTPMFGISYQEYAKESLALPELGLLAKFPHFDLVMGVNHRILRTMIKVNL